MDLRECYDAFGGSYNDVIGRLLTEVRVEKFLLLFMKDTSFHELEDAMERGDYDTAFRAAHTLKGVCSNLGIDKLGKAASEMTEALRIKDIAAAGRLLPTVADDYRLTSETLKKFLEK